MSYQNDFIKALQAIHPAAEIPVEDVPLELHLRAQDKRWQVYRNAYFARFSQALCENIYERAARLYGHAYLENLLQLYLYTLPPQQSLMTGMLPGFVAYLRSWGSCEQVPELLDLLELSYRRWQVLIDEDPSTTQVSIDEPGRWSQIHLQSNHALIVSAYPIFELWTAGDPDQSSDHEVFIHSHPQTVVCFKSSPVDLELMEIKEPWLRVFESLSQGQSLEAALGEQNTKNLSEIELVELGERIRYLARTGGLQLKGSSL